MLGARLQKKASRNRKNVASARNAVPGRQQVWNAPEGAHSRSRRQVDLPPFHDLRAASPSARHGSRGSWRATTCCAPRRPAGRSAPPVAREAPGRWRIVGAGIGGLMEPSDILDFGDAGTGSRLMMGVAGEPPDHLDLRRRCLAAQAPHAPDPRSAEHRDGRHRGQRGRGWTGASHPPRSERDDPDYLRNAWRPRLRSSRRSCSPASTPPARPP